MPARQEILNPPRHETWTEADDWRPQWCEAQPTKREPEIIQLGCSAIHRHTGRVESPKGEQYLRRKELELLEHLFEHASTAFTREQLLEVVWNYRPNILTRTVDQTVATLRKKIEVNPEHPRVLQTVYGIGYRLVLDN